MRGRKGSVDEGGLRAPLLIRWPGRIRPGTRVGQIAGAIDLLPTLADLAGVQVAAAKPLDGKNLKPLLLGQGADWPDRMIFSLQRNRVSVRTQRFRLDAEGRLYDIAADPGQTRDIAGENSAEASRLKRAVDEWSRQMLPLVGEDTRPFPVGHAPLTRLPARDGVPEGGVKRSANAPNSSYFTNWTAPAGRFEAEIGYTCPRGQEGSTVELSFLGAKAEARIEPPHDPPLVGAAEDRVPRGESYVKDFRPLRLGSLRLEKGRGKLTLRAVRIAANQVADVRYVNLRRIK
jgi:hypothetical protein